MNAKQNENKRKQSKNSKKINEKNIN